MLQPSPQPHARGPQANAGQRRCGVLTLALEQVDVPIVERQQQCGESNAQKNGTERSHCGGRRDFQIVILY